jgi:hypothetical protein
MVGGWISKPAPQSTKLNVPLKSPRLVASEGDVTAGALRANDAYDLKLYEMPGGSYEMVVFMKLQFFFESGDGGAWTPDEKQQYMRNWQMLISTAWGGRQLKRLKSGKSVSVRLEFSVQEAGWMLDHWEITVTKIKPGEFQHSWVNCRNGNGGLNSNSLTPFRKAPPNVMQRPAVHEFGHTMGLDDEYKPGTTYAGDKRAAMNAGEGLRGRYDGTLLDWLGRKLRALGIE